MRLISKLYDHRIKAHNLLFEIDIEEYLSMSTSIIENNEFQRKRVRSSSTIYSLLRKDLTEGCIIPPIVLALSSDTQDDKFHDLTDDQSIEYITQNKNRLIILDGLQRTLTIRDLHKSLEEEGFFSEEKLKNLKELKLRIEVYLGINKVGILYRMLTLNTGQTPMSMRHQIEILYSDYRGEDFGGLSLIMESENKPARGSNEYSFKEIVEGFNSYLNRDYLPMNRNSILDNIESLEKLSMENQDTDLFLDYLNAFDGLVKALVKKSEGWQLNPNADLSISSSPFGKDAEGLFKKSQLMTGFGSAVGKLVDHGVINGFNDLTHQYDKINLGDVDQSFNNYIQKLDLLGNMAKKIGNDQRMFFHYFFRELFDRKGDAYLNFNYSVEEAYRTYIRKTQ